MIVIALSEAHAEQISCEKLVKSSHDELICLMQETTTIDSNRATFSPQSDSSVKTINFSKNKKIFHLPIRFDRNFPNLTGIAANECSLVALSKLTFRNLETLIWLDVERNKIENISDDIFEDLVLLEALLLS